MRVMRKAKFLLRLSSYRGNEEYNLLHKGFDTLSIGGVLAVRAKKGL